MPRVTRRSSRGSLAGNVSSFTSNDSAKTTTSVTSVTSNRWSFGGFGAPQLSARQLSARSTQSEFSTYTACDVPHRQDFGSGFGTCTECGASYCFNRGCPDTKKVICSKCWPTYVNDRQSFIENASTAHEDDSPRDESEPTCASESSTPETEARESELPTSYALDNPDFFLSLLTPKLARIDDEAEYFDPVSARAMELSNGESDDDSDDNAEAELDTPRTPRWDTRRKVAVDDGCDLQLSTTSESVVKTDVDTDAMLIPDLTAQLEKQEREAAELLAAVEEKSSNVARTPAVGKLNLKIPQFSLASFDGIENESFATPHSARGMAPLSARRMAPLSARGMAPLSARGMPPLSARGRTPLSARVLALEAELVQQEEEAVAALAAAEAKVNEAKARISELEQEHGALDANTAAIRTRIDDIEQFNVLAEATLQAELHAWGRISAITELEKEQVAKNARIYALERELASRNAASLNRSVSCALAVCAIAVWCLAFRPQCR